MEEKSKGAFGFEESMFITALVASCLLVFFFTDTGTKKQGQKKEGSRGKASNRNLERPMLRSWGGRGLKGVHLHSK